MYDEGNIQYLKSYAPEKKLKSLQTSDKPTPESRPKTPRDRSHLRVIK